MKHQILLMIEDLEKDIFIVLVLSGKTSCLWQIYCPLAFLYKDDFSELFRISKSKTNTTNTHLKQTLRGLFLALLLFQE